MAGMLALQSCQGTTKEADDKKAPKMPGVSASKTICRSTLGATIKSPVGATRIGAAVMYDRLRTLVMGNSPIPANATRVDGRLLEGAGGEAFERLLDQQKLPARTLGSVEFMIDGTAFFPVYLDAIDKAQESVDVETFIFDNDDVSVDVADALKAKSHEVPVRVRYDGCGSDEASKKAPKTLPAGFVPPKDMRAHLTQGSKVAVRRTSNPYFVADHAKLHIIDGKTVFIGGMNIGREYRHELHDMMSRVQGPVVQDLAEIYEQRWHDDAWWRKFGPKKTTVSLPPVSEAPKDLQELRVLHTDARSGRREVLKAALISFRCAKRRIWLETPYYSSDEITDELKAAVKRGVDVRVVVPAQNDYQIMEANNAADLKELIDGGAKVYLYPGMTHLKATVCDDWAMYGSANYDTLSLRVNFELNLATSDPRTVNTLATQVFERDFRTGKRMTAAMAEAIAKSRGGPLAEFAGDQL